MGTTYNDRVAGEVRAELARQRMSQADLASRVGVSQVFISRRLTGAVSFSVKELERVAEALKVDVAQFLAVDGAA